MRTFAAFSNLEAFEALISDGRNRQLQLSLVVVVALSVYTRHEIRTVYQAAQGGEKVCLRQAFTMIQNTKSNSFYSAGNS